MNHSPEKGVESYIVRVYRKPEEPSKDMAGLVEKVGTPEKIPFKNKEELWQIMQNKPKTKQKTRKNNE
jgi:hypothetical protein